jgi:DNA-binding transcriptional LysR family regulator
MENRPELSWDDLRVLLAISRTGSFKGAAQAIGLATSTVSRRVDALERVLGQRVVRRLSEGATIEPRATELLKLAGRMEADLAIAARDLGDAQVSGILRVALGAGFLRFVSEAITRFRAQHPLVDFELMVDSRLADVSKREADLALRTGKVDGDGIVYRQAGPLPFGLYAGARFVARHGSLTVTDLTAVDVIGYCGDMAAQPAMRWFRERGVKRFPVLASSTEGVIACALDGLGVAALPAVVGGAVEGLHRLASPAVPPGKSVYVAYHRDLRAVPKVKRFADLMVETLERHLRA